MFEKNQILIDISDNYFRPSEVETLLGDSSLAQKELGWIPEYSIDMLVKEMMDEDLKLFNA